jgi:uncharacterized protein YqfA (UPF0365 family)
LFVLIFLAVLAVFISFFRVWLRTFLHGQQVSMVALIGMRLRGAPLRLITDALIELAHSKSPATIGDVERAYHANIARVRSSSDLAAIVREQSKSHSA